MTLSRHLRLGRRLTLVGGKGGVGKTTVAAALALELAAEQQVVVVSTDPAHSLGDALETSLDRTPAPVPGVPNLTAVEVDAEFERQRFLAEHEAHIRTLLERGTYLDDSDVAEITGLTIPGMDELGAVLRLHQLCASGEARVVVDTAPTGHTLRLLDLPTTALRWVDALEAMDAKHQAVASALTGRASADAVTDFLADLRRTMNEVAELIRDPEATRFILVSNPQPVVVAESGRYLDALAERGVNLGGLVVNRARKEGEHPPEDERTVWLPQLESQPVGIDRLRRFAEAAEGEPPAPEARPASPAIVLGESYRPPTDRRIYLVGGKGGVGKSTTAAGLAIHLARAGAGRVRLLSVDPAGSLGDILLQEVGGEPVESAVPGLQVQQIDAAAEWRRFREEYRDRVEEVFSNLLGPSLSATYDRAIIEGLLDLAPPGIDELVALLEVVDSIEDTDYDALVVDTAPTGHFLRLLEMPELALGWTHALLRLLLKYREVVHLGGLAEEVLELSRSFRELRTRLQDGSRTWVVLVALPEALSIPETRRLIERLKASGIPAGTLLVNQAWVDGAITRPEVAELRRLGESLDVAAAPRLPKGPKGYDAIEGLADAWRRIEEA